MTVIPVIFRKPVVAHRRSSGTAGNGWFAPTSVPRRSLQYVKSSSRFNRIHSPFSGVTPQSGDRVGMAPPRSLFLGGRMNEPILQFFEYKHLREDLQPVSKPFGELAEKIAMDFPRNPERTVALRKLLEAKDAAVRCCIYMEEKP